MRFDKRKNSGRVEPSRAAPHSFRIEALSSHVICERTPGVTATDLIQHAGVQAPKRALASNVAMREPTALLRAQAGDGQIERRHGLALHEGRLQREPKEDACRSVEIATVRDRIQM